MAKKPTVTTVSSGFASNTQLNANFTALRDAFDNTLSLDGSSPNAMGADLDLNNNDLLNASVVNTATLKIGGVNVVPSAATALAIKKEFNTVAALLADTGTYSSYAENDYLRVVDGGFTYRVAASSASDHHVITAGGVKLYVLPGSDGFRNADAFNVVGDNTTEVSSALQAVFSVGGRIRLGRGKQYVINKRVTFPSNFHLDFNGAQIRSAVSGYVAGSTPNNAAMICPATIDVVDGSSFTENVIIQGPGKILHGSSQILAGLYLGAIKNFVVRGLNFEGQAGISNWTFGCIVNHAAQMGRIEDCRFVYTAAAPNVGGNILGGCAATRNTAFNAAAYVDDITWQGCSFYKNNNSTDELYWHNGASGVCSNIRHIGCSFETGPSDATPSMVTVYNFSSNESITGSIARASIWIGNSFKMRGTSVNYHMLLGFTGDVRPVEGVIVEGNSFDIGSGVGVFVLSPVEGVTIANNVFSSAGGQAVSFTPSLAGTQDVSAIGNKLRGSYAFGFVFVPTIKDNWCEECTIFALGPKVVEGNTADLVRLNFIEHAGSYDMAARGNDVSVSGYVSGVVRATYYLSGAGNYSVTGDKVTYNSNDTWQVLRSPLSGASKITFKDNNLRLGSGAGGVKPSFLLFSTEMGRSGGNYFFDQEEDSVATTFGFGVSGYLPQIGHVQYLNNVATGASVAFARMRISGNYRTISAVVA